MNENVETIRDNFLRNIDELYRNIDSWLSTSALTTEIEEIEISEEKSGQYAASQLVIYNEDKCKLGFFSPVGAWVIGANGRVDLIGKLDKVIIVHLEKAEDEESVLESTNSVRSEQKTSAIPFYNGIEHTGWYWIEDRRRGKAHLLDESLFRELVTEVSDYEF